MPLTATSEMPTALDTIKRQLDATAGNMVVKESIKRHYEHLEALAAGLRKLGMDGHEVDDNIMQVFREYERELVAYMSGA